MQNTAKNAQTEWDGRKKNTQSIPKTDKINKDIGKDTAEFLGVDSNEILSCTIYHGESKEEIDLTEAELEEITLTPEQEEELKKKLLFAINQDTETGQVEICPMNEKNCIILHGAEEMKWFINRLREAIQ